MTVTLTNGTTAKVDWVPPKRISSLELDLNAQLGTYQDRTGASAVTAADTDGDSVGSLLDQSGNGNHFVAASDGVRPTLKIDRVNGRRTLLFNGTDQYLQQATSDLVRNRTEITVLVVAKYATLTNQQALFAASTNDGSNNRVGLYKRTASSGNFHKTSIMRGDAGAAVYSSGSLSVPSSVVGNTNWHVRALRMSWAGSTNGQIEDYVDGQLACWNDFTFDNDSNENPTDDTASARATIGCLGTLANYLDGEIARVLLWSKWLSDSELADVHRWSQSWSSRPAQSLTAPTLNVSDQASITTKRNEIIAEVWSGNGFPSDGFTSTSSSVTDPISSITQSGNLLRVDSFVCDMSDNDGGDDFKSITGYVWYPIATADTGRLTLLPLDHGNDWNSSSAGYRELIVSLLNAGSTVVGWPMPDLGSVSAHNAYPDPTATLNYLKFFMDVPARALNALTSYSEVSMAGLSGGAWTTTLFAAIDTRVGVSWEVAGSLAKYQYEIRDWEQNLPGLDDLDYPDLHVMATDAGRNKYQTLNRFDTCCFGYRHFVSGADYSPTVSTAVSALTGSGSWSFAWDDSEQDHTMSEATRGGMLSAFGVLSPPSGATLVQSILDGTTAPDTDGVLEDSTANDNDAQAVQSTCASFSGSQAYDSTTGVLDLSGDFTFGIWLQWTATGLSVPYACRTSGSNSGEQCLIICNIGSAGDITFRVGGVNVTWSGSLNDGNPHYVLCTKSGTSLELFVDNTSRGTGTAGSVTSGSGRETIGDNSTGPGGSLSGQKFSGQAWGQTSYTGVLGSGARETLYARQIVSSPTRLRLLAEGAQVAAYDVSGNGGSLLPVATAQWSTQDLYHYNLAKGFTLSGSARIPALLDGLADAAGNAITNPAGSWHNAAETKLDLSDAGGPAAWSFGDQILAPSYYSEINSIKAESFRRYTF
jgi:hypothetical protein